MPLIQIGTRPTDASKPSDRASKRMTVAIMMDVHGGKPNKYTPHIGAKQQAKWAKAHQ